MSHSLRYGIAAIFFGLILTSSLAGSGSSPADASNNQAVVAASADVPQAPSPKTVHITIDALTNRFAF